MFIKKAKEQLNLQRWDRLRGELKLDFENAPQCSIMGLPVIPPGLRQIIINRNKSFHLQGRIVGQAKYPQITEFFGAIRAQWDEMREGTLIPTHTVSLDYFGSAYKIHGFHISKTGPDEVVDKSARLEDSIIRYNIGFGAHSIEVAWDTLWERDDSDKFKIINVNTLKDRPSILREWCINAPNREHAYLLRTTRRENRFLCRESDDGNSKLFDYVDGSTGRDHFKFNYNGFEIKVFFLKSIRPIRVSKKVAIEYYSKEHRSPSVEERKIVIEFLSFVFGRYLMSIGNSRYIDIRTGVEMVSFSAQCPWSDDLISRANQSSNPPIDFSIGLFRNAEQEEQAGDDYFSIEQFLEQFLPRYEQERRNSALADLLWGMWATESLPAREKLPLYASALETVAKAFLEARQISLEYLPKEQAALLRNAVQDTVRNYFENLDDRAPAKETQRIITEKLSNFNQFGGNERIRKFFAELRIKLSEAEKKAMRMRHSAAHGDRSVLSEGDDAERHQDVVHEYCYRTLLYRIFLKILGYTRHYVDYATPGFPSRMIDEPAGEESNT